jgi:PKD repeat protein
LIGEQVNFTGTATNATNYSWNFGDGNTAQGSLTQQHTYAAIGEYLVTFTAFNDSCSETLSQTVYVGTVGINNQPVSNLSIYGQGEKVVIQFNNWGGNKANITMYNTLGQRLESLTGVSTIKGRQELNVAGIIPGYYFIQVVSGDKVESKKVYLGNN